MAMIVRDLSEVGSHRVPAKQEFAKESDINVIMKRALLSGQLPVSNMGHQPVFADVSEIGDFADVMRRVDAAKEAFESLPAKVRSKFRHDPSELIEFLQDPANRDEAIKLGLVEPPAPPVVEPPAPPVVEPPAPVVK